MVEIIDRAPEGRKMSKPQIILLTVLFLAVFGVIYVMNHNPNAKKDMVVINVGGIDILPGETKITEFLEAGFDLGLNQPKNILDESEKMEKNSYIPLIVLSKGGKSYGTMSLGNATGKEAPLSDSIILKFSVYTSDENSAEVTADGIAMKELTKESLIEAYGEADDSEENTYIGGTDFDWENKGYYFSVNIGEDGKVHSLSSSQKHY